ncbi:hypothetical protein HER21_28610 [Pseudomonas sp. BGM005]|nr:hypothetical protein [Pseudomonas sp. BG5]
MAAAESALDKLLHDWAAWCFGGFGSLGSGSSMLARLIDRKGEIFFDGASGPRGPADGLEQKIESIVMEMAAKNLQQADVLRLEYGAGWWWVCDRWGIEDYDPADASQLDRARALGLSWRTYKRRLAAAREMIAERLGGMYARR